MNIGIRILLILIVVPSVYYFVYWIPFSLLSLHDNYLIPSIISVLIAIGTGWFVWSSTGVMASAKGLGKMIALGAVIVGGAGFALGFFGPIIFMPNANQGPLIGIFFTGPLGFLLGGFGGLVYWLMQNKKSSLE